MSCRLNANTVNAMTRKPFKGGLHFHPSVNLGEIRALAHQRNTDLRTAAYELAIRRVNQAMALRGFSYGDFEQDAGSKECSSWINSISHRDQSGGSEGALVTEFKGGMRLKFLYFHNLEYVSA